MIVAPLFRPRKGAKGATIFYAAYALVGIAMQVRLSSAQERYAARCSLIFSVIYWFVWFIVLPRYRGYKLEDESDILDDGTKVTRLVRRDL